MIRINMRRLHQCGQCGRKFRRKLGHLIGHTFVRGCVNLICYGELVKL